MDRVVVALLQTAQVLTSHARLPVVHIEPRALKELPEYSMSTPTGVVIGKRWKRNAMIGVQMRFGRCESLWEVCEYMQDPRDDGYALVVVSRPVAPTRIEHLRP